MENRNRIVSLEKSKAMKKIKELKEKQERESKEKNKQQSVNNKNSDFDADTSLKSDKPSLDLNPFGNDSYQDSNPFLNSPVDSAYRDGNPFASEGKLGNPYDVF